MNRLTLIIMVFLWTSGSLMVEVDFRPWLYLYQLSDGPHLLKSGKILFE